jgi:hypothetical protein
MRLLILLLAALAGCASVARADGLNLDPWTREDTYRQAAVTALLLADWQQTRHMAKQRCPTSNPQCAVPFGEGGFAENFIGSHPSVGQVNNYFVAGIVGHAAISYVLPRGWREGWTYVWIGIEAQTVRTNYLGIKYGF